MNKELLRAAAASSAVCLTSWLVLQATAGNVGLQHSISKGALTLLEQPLVVVAVALSASAVAFVSAKRLRVTPRRLLVGVLVGDGLAGLVLAPLAVGELEPVHAPLVFASVSLLGVQPAAAVVGAWTASVEGEPRTWTHRLPVAMCGFGALMLGISLILPWAFVSGMPVGLDWVGPQAVAPVALTALATILAITFPERGRWVAVGAILLGVFAGYGTIALARAIPTMAAVWAGADGSRGSALAAVFAAEALFVSAALGTLAPRFRGSPRG